MRFILLEIRHLLIHSFVVTSYTTHSRTYVIHTNNIVNCHSILKEDEEEEEGLICRSNIIAILCVKWWV